MNGFSLQGIAGGTRMERQGIVYFPFASLRSSHSPCEFISDVISSSNNSLANHNIEKKGNSSLSNRTEINMFFGFYTDGYSDMQQKNSQ